MKSYLDLTVQELKEDSSCYKVSRSFDDMWIYCCPTDWIGPKQGMKIHVSAGLPQAVECLIRTISHLAKMRVQFKICSSGQKLGLLNGGFYGFSQIGKFMTVYPRSDEEALSVVHKLLELTKGISGPRVPSDFRIIGSSTLHYRFGGFNCDVIRTPLGTFKSMVQSPTGEVLEDIRASKPSLIPGVFDIFEENGLKTPEVDESPIICDRFLKISTISRAARGPVVLALDTVTRRSVVLKFGFRDAVQDLQGANGAVFVKNEYEILKHLRNSGTVVPALYFAEFKEYSILGTQLSSGEPLSSYIERICIQTAGLIDSIQALYGLAIKLCAAVLKVHSKGVIIRDIKPNNLLLQTNGDIVLVDLETAYLSSIAMSSFTRGTQGYMSPQQAASNKPTYADDIYSLGATLRYLFTGADASREPTPEAMSNVSCRLFNPAIPSELDSLIRGCLSKTASKRPRSLKVVLDEILRIVKLNQYGERYGIPEYCASIR